jgi:hypothetical protein
MKQIYLEMYKCPIYSDYLNFSSLWHEVHAAFTTVRFGY